MAGTTTPEFLRIIVSEMMKERRENDFDLELAGNSKIGDGYMGDMIFFKVTTRRNGEVYNLVMKSFSKNEKIREGRKLDVTFNREAFVYTTIIPSLQSFVKSKSEFKTLMEFAPKLYWHSGEFMKEALILEDLKSSGYIMSPKMKALDMEHTLLVLKSLAEWHGTIMAYRDQNPEKFHQWIPNTSNLRFDFMVQTNCFNSFIPGQLKRMYKVLESRGYKELAQKYRRYEPNIKQYLSSAEDETERLVITHGDCWLNNIMYKYQEGSEVPSAVKLFDFQFSTLNTPVEDLSFFIYGSCDKTVLAKFDVLLHEYYQTLSATIEKLGSIPQDLFTFEQLKEHWRKYGIFGVILTSASLRLQYYLDEEIPDRDSVEPDEFADKLDIDLKNEELFSERLLDVLLHYGNQYMSD